MCDDGVRRNVFVTGAQWDLMYWIWRLSGKDIDFNSMLAELITDPNDDAE